MGMNKTPQSRGMSSKTYIGKYIFKRLKRPKKLREGCLEGLGVVFIGNSL